MKKRIFMLALVVGLLMAFSASAWAEDDKDYYFKLGDKAYQGKVINDASTKNVTISFQVKVPYQVVAAGTEVDGYYKSANLVKWTVTESGSDEATFTTSKVTIYRANTKVDDYTDDDFVANPYYLIDVSNGEWYEGKGTVTLNIEVTGTMTNLTDDINISVGLYSANGDTLITTDTIANATDTPADQDEVDTTTVSDGDSLNPRDPDSVEWDGLDPAFPLSADGSHITNTLSGDIGKNKPKLGKIDKANLTFTPGTEKTLTVPMEGPIATVDVYVAQKDAKKLWPASADAITADIHLTSASIKAYHIPFRVTSYDFAQEVTGSTAKEQQKAWKSAANSLTIAFNGAKVQYKGFPLTISMSNSNTSSKPVAKALKLNVGSTFTEPAWTYEVASKEVTADEDTYTAWQEDGDTADYGVESSAYVYDEYNSETVTYTPEGGSDEANVTKTLVEEWLGITTTADTAFLSGDSEYYVVYGDNEYVYTTVLQPASWYRYVNIAKELGKKDKPEASTWVNPDAGTGEEKAGYISATFTASGDAAPYAITVKPDDATKLGKFFDTGYELDIVQPKYNYLGEVEEHGYVTISGQPKETTKESKLALTLTATNPSTKKKAAAKVTAIGKTQPVIDKTTAVTITDDMVAAWVEENEDADYEYPYGEAEGTYKRITTKAVEAGKTPSVKVKAKGSKTIEYKLGKYIVNEESGTLEEEEGYEDFNEELATKLTALKLSFDAKKGAVILASKSDKNTLPTLNESEDAFKSLDIVVTAYNSVGADQAWAAIEITGAKPAVSDKEVSFALTDAAYSYKTFKLKAGKTEGSASATGMNIKATAPSATVTELAKYGLEMVTYDNIWVQLDSYDTVAEDQSMPTGWTDDSEDLIVEDSGTVKSDTKDDVTTYTAGEGGVSYYNGEKYAVRSTDVSLKNQGIIQVVDTELLATKGDAKTAKGVAITVALENFGAVNEKGKLKVKVPAPATTSTRVTAAQSVTAEAAKKAKTSSAGSKNATLPDGAKADGEDVADETAGEGTLTLGAARTIADLTAEQQAFLAQNGYKVIAVLPEVTADADGQYDLDEAELDEDAPENAKLIWIPFPKNAEPSEDDEIVDFYDDAGAPVEGVPASHKVIASPWLRENVTYEPVIAIEAE